MSELAVRWFAHPSRAAAGSPRTARPAKPIVRTLVDPMRSLATLLLEHDGDRFAASIPTSGDVTRDPDAPRASGLVTIGVSASDLAWLARLGRVTLRLITPEGQPVMRARIERVDPRFSLVIAKVLERTRGAP